MFFFTGTIDILYKESNRTRFFSIPLIILSFICLYNNADLYSDPLIKYYSWMGDFYCFKAEADIFQINYKNLYNQEELFKRQNFLVEAYSKKNIGLMPFVYPPFVAQLLLPIANFEYIESYRVFSLVSLITISVSIILLLYYFNFSKIGLPFIFISVLGLNNIFTDTILNGQLSVIGFVSITLILLSIKFKKDFILGFLLSILSYKFPLYLVFGFFVLLTSTRKVTYGLIAGLLFIYLVSSIHVGYDWPVLYFDYAKNYFYGSTSYGDTPFYPKKGAGLYQQLYLLFSNYNTLRWIIYSSILTFLSLPFLFNIKKTNLDNDYKITFLCCSLILSIYLSIQCISYDTAIMVTALIVIYSRLKNIEAKTQFILLASLSSVIMMFPQPKDYIGSLLPHFLMSSLWVLYIYYWRLYNRDSKALFLD